MLFTSYEFIGFVALTLLLFYLVPNRFQWIVLLLADVVFYLCAGWQGICFMAVTVIASWAAVNLMGRNLKKEKTFLKSDEGKALAREEKKAFKKKQQKFRLWCMLGALFVDIGILAVLKYTNFVLTNLGAIFNFSKQVELIIPLGVSFYTFQTVGYVIDVYWEKVEPEKSLLKTALFTSFFPLLIQGPISRFGDLKDTLFSGRRFDYKTVCFGLQRVVWGYFKKLVVADRLLPAVKVLCGDAAAYDGVYAFLGAVFYAAELYADFTGGIDITIGIAEMFGITLQENFIRPYFSRNIAEYWRRWHISMGTWFKDYIFYPLSVAPWLLKLSKKAKKLSEGFGRKLSVYVSTIITWFLTGLWHGAAWNFIVWGLLNAVIILAAEEFKPLSQKFRARFPRLVAGRAYHVFEILRTFLMMCALRMLDCYRNVAVSFRAFFSVFTARHFTELFHGGLMNLGLSVSDYLVAGIGVLLMFAVSVFQEKQGSVRAFLWNKNAARIALFVLLFLCVLVFGAYGVGYDSSQFIYNQF